MSYCILHAGLECPLARQHIRNTSDRQHREVKSAESPPRALPSSLLLPRLGFVACAAVGSSNAIINAYLTLYISLGSLARLRLRTITPRTGIKVCVCMLRGPNATSQSHLAMYRSSRQQELSSFILRRQTFENSQVVRTVPRHGAFDVELSL